MQNFTQVLGEQSYQHIKKLYIMRKYDFHLKFIQNSINITDYINTIKEKTHTIISIDTEKVLHEFQHFF